MTIPETKPADGPSDPSPVPAAPSPAIAEATPLQVMTWRAESAESREASTVEDLIAAHERNERLYYQNEAIVATASIQRMRCIALGLGVGLILGAYALLILLDLTKHPKPTTETDHDE